MAFQPAGAARYQYRAQRLRRRLLIAVGVILVLVALGAAVRMLLSPKAAGNAPAETTSPPLSFQAKQDIDVNLVASAIGQYASANGALPTHFSAASDGGLVLCGTVCDPALYEVSSLSVYQAANIKLMNYAPGLGIPDQATMYMIPGAKCGDGGRLGGPNATPRSAVILYSAVTDTGTKPRCVVL